MSSSTAPPPPPKSGSNGYIAVAAVMLVVMGGLIVWKLGDDEPEVVEQTTVAPPADANPVLDEAPPPPPPEEEAAPEAPKPPEKKEAVAGGGPSGCAGACNGNLGADGMSALRAKGGQARGCYNRALRQDATLSGKMSLNVRISASGNVCSVQVGEDSLGDPAVTSCVTQMFRSGKFPAPEGGCVDAAVPLNFVAPK